MCVDLSKPELDVMGKALVGLIDSHTQKLRTRAAPQLSAHDAAQMLAEIRYAAQLAGRLTFPPMQSRETAE